MVLCWLLTYALFVTQIYGDGGLEYLKINSVIQSRFATTLVTSLAINNANESKEFSFLAILPDEAFITNFSLKIGDRLSFGDVREKEKASEVYRQALRRGQSAGLVAQKPRESNAFQISVNVAPGEQVQFNLTYQEVLRRVHGVYRHIINVQPSLPVQAIDVSVQIREIGEINVLKVPKFGQKIGEKSNEELLRTAAQDDVFVEQINTGNVSSAFVSYTIRPELKNQSINGQLAILYDVRRDISGGSIQVVDGYFVHFFSPEGFEPGPKLVVFVLDKSGSMQGTKFSQTKAAMKRILAELRDEDRISIIMFSGRIDVWKPEPVLATKEKREEARGFVMNTEAEGLTNIDGALTKALEILHAFQDERFISMIIFMTDGEPTEGETLPDKIVSHISALNRNLSTLCPIHSLAFGRSADYKLVQRLSNNNAGLARRVYEDSDADLQLAGFYHEISTPLLTDVQFEYLNGSVDVRTLVSPASSHYALYRGGEQVLVGRLLSASPLFDALVSAKSTGTGQGVQLRSQALGLKCRGHNCCSGPDCLYWPKPIESRPVADVLPPASSIGGFVERMWAYLTARKALANFELGEDADGKRKALDLSLKYKFVNQLTSMVVVQEDKNETLMLSKAGERETERHDYHTFGGRPGSMKAAYLGSAQFGMPSQRSGGASWSSHHMSYQPLANNVIVADNEPEPLVVGGAKKFIVGLNPSDSVLAYLDSENAGSAIFAQNLALLNQLRSCLQEAGHTSIIIKLEPVRLDWNGTLERVSIRSNWDRQSVSSFNEKTSAQNGTALAAGRHQVILLLDAPFRRAHDSYVLDIVARLKTSASRLYLVHLAPIDTDDRLALAAALQQPGYLVLNRQKDQMSSLCFSYHE